MPSTGLSDGKRTRALGIGVSIDVFDGPAITMGARQWRSEPAGGSAVEG